MDRCKDCNRVNCVCEICCECESLITTCKECNKSRCDCDPCVCQGWDGEDSFYSNDLYNHSYNPGIYDFVG
jgi:hypothetical protein